MNISLLPLNNKEVIIMNLLHFSNILSVVVPILLSVAFMTIIERKMLAAMQRRLGPTDVGLDNKNIVNKDYWNLSFASITHIPFTDCDAKEKPLRTRHFIEESIQGHKVKDFFIVIVFI